MALQRRRPRTLGRRLYPLRPSTRVFYREGRKIEGYSLLDFVHGYVYSRWPYLYIGAATGAKPAPLVLRPLVRLGAWATSRRKLNADPARNAFADRYHGKVVPLDAAERLVTLDVDIELRGLERVIPYPVARDIVLRHPDHIAALECPCRASRKNPCQPLDVCLIVGEPFASFITEHHPTASRWISQAEAVEILRAEHERGHVHHAFFKDAMLGRFYAICNCCSCCCGAMQAFQHGTPMLASSGFVSRVEIGSCVRCGACVEACPFDTLAIGETAVRVDEARCMGCGVCVSRCPNGALALARDETKPEPLDVG
ncbi:MAG: 4Fe-4S binding protein [Candidatus Bipolaricaulis sp.]|nr:4Fe-4S binding protein [Candidatus Bipolaricaulis sp.]